MVVREALNYGEAQLRKAEIADAKTDAFLLFEAVTGFDRAACLLHPDRKITEEKLAAYQSFLERRMRHEPCQYILGNCDFYGLNFFVNENVLIPRQDTEVLVETALSFLSGNAEVLDLCTGSGAVAVALKKNRPDLCVTGADISEAALSVAVQNAKNHQCEIRMIQSDLFDGFEKEEKFDVIVSNPPYVTEAEYEELMPEVKEFEPRLALTAGEDGLDIYKRLISRAPGHLKPQGMLFVEIGCFQAESVSQLFRENGFQDIRVIKDLAGLDRVVYGRTETCLIN